MISFRYHITTLVAVFIALAVGIVLGGGPLTDLGRAGGSKDAGAVADAATDLRATSAEEALGQLVPGLYGSGLKGRQVAVVRLPGVDDATVEAVTEQITGAAGTTVDWTVSPELVSAGEKSLVDTLGSQLLAQAPKDLITPGAPTYERMGELIGVGLATTVPDGDTGSAQTSTILEGIETAELLSGPATGGKRSPLVLVLAGDPELAGGRDVLLSGLVSGLAVQSVGVVVATTTGADLAASLHESKTTEKVLVVDGAEGITGQVSLTLGLVRSLAIQGGSFGTTGADGTLPVG